jgi:hypothetical protein
MVQSISGGSPAPVDYAAATPVQVPAPAVTPAPVTTPTSALSRTPPADPSAELPPQSTRVVVEPGANKAVLVFKLLDRATGAVLSEIPNQSPQEAAGNPGYRSGALLNQQV